MSKRDEAVFYVDRLSEMTDDELARETETQVWLSAFASNNPRAPAHWKSELCQDAAEGREKPWLYQRGWNAAYRSAGYEPNEEQIALARTPEPSNA